MSADNKHRTDLSVPTNYDFCIVHVLCSVASGRAAGHALSCTMTSCIFARARTWIYGDRVLQKIALFTVVLTAAARTRTERKAMRSHLGVCQHHNKALGY